MIFASLPPLGLPAVVKSKAAFSGFSDLDGRSLGPAAALKAAEEVLTYLQHGLIDCLSAAAVILQAALADAMALLILAMFDSSSSDSSIRKYLHVLHLRSGGLLPRGLGIPRRLVSENASVSPI